MKKTATSKDHAPASSEQEGDSQVSTSSFSGKNAEFSILPSPQAQLLEQHGFSSFEDFWSLPRDFIDDINYRKGGWSAVSKLDLGTGNPSEVFYVKRQENQKRYSLAHPFGALSYRYELASTQRNLKLQLPAVNIVSYGFRKQSGVDQGLIVTQAIPFQSLQEIYESGEDWHKLLSQLSIVGELLHKMNLKKISHGALYPKHIYLNVDTSEVSLLDFERSRVCLSVRAAVSRDLQQLIKRITWMPANAIERLLNPYLVSHPVLTQKILAEHGLTIVKEKFA